MSSEKDSNIPEEHAELLLDGFTSILQDPIIQALGSSCPSLNDFKKVAEKQMKQMQEIMDLKQYGDILPGINDFKDFADKKRAQMKKVIDKKASEVDHEFGDMKSMAQEIKEKARKSKPAR